MAFLTDRKRASGLGAAKTGTEHFWGMTISSAALLILVPLFVFTVGPMIGENTCQKCVFVFLFRSVKLSLLEHFWEGPATGTGPA